LNARLDANHNELIAIIDAEMEVIWAKTKAMRYKRMEAHMNDG
jgi:hypothetical protein